MPRLHAFSARSATPASATVAACRTRAAARAAAEPRRARLSAKALFTPNDETRFLPSTMTSSTSSRTPSAPRIRVFEKIASAVAINAVVARFENLAGRAAMISFLLAAGMEAGGRPFFASASEAASASASSAAAAAATASTSPLIVASLALAAALAAAAAAAASVPSRPGHALLEPVVVSLTGAQRALGAISVSSLWAAAPPGKETGTDAAEAAAAVDGAVDAALDGAFGAEFLAAVLGYGDEDILA